MPLPTAGDIVRVGGVVTDAAGDIFIAIRTDRSSGSDVSYLLKYDANCNFVTSSVVDTGDNGTGFFQPLGLVYSTTADQIYVSNRGVLDDCVSIFDTDLIYVTTAVPAAGNGTAAKGIHVTMECCPLINTSVIDTVLCNTTLNTKYFLDELLACTDGIICEGSWTVDPGNTGIIFDACDDSFTTTSADACGTFTLSSDGSNANSQCGAFSVELNVAFADLTLPTIAGDQTVCAGDDPAAFTVSTVASGSGNLVYQWQSSTVNCTTGFTDISGATSATYDPPAGISQTTYYRLVTAVNTNCDSGLCGEPSNCITVEVIEVPQATVTFTDTTCGEDNGSITFTYPDAAGRTNIEFSLDGGATYPFDFADDIGSATISDLAAGTYDLWVRWGNTECPVGLPDVTIGTSTAAACVGITVTRN